VLVTETAETAHLPVIDVSPALSGHSGPARVAVTRSLHEALHETGFMYVVGHGLDASLLASAFRSASRFFARPLEEKTAVAYTDSAANFGFQGIEGERLDPANAPDLKEAFTMRNALAASPAHAAALASASASAPASAPTRWPDEGFRTDALRLFAAGLSTAHTLLALLAESLQLPSDYFTPLHRGENVTLRFLHYPANLPFRSSTQLGAGEHTDYGSITLLFQQEVGGLEVRDRAGQWRFAPPLPDAIVINTGDLMERWTNGRFRSTVHRVRPIVGDRDRYSIALFVDPDSAVQVECIPSCIEPGMSPRYPAITAGEHLRQKIEATHR
jgi:isopenicillin N synthase-like dioxygenase